jgi:hypothetical protein
LVVAPAKFTFQFGHPKSESPSTLLEQLTHIHQQTLALVIVEGRWSAQEIDFVDWVFNSAAVLRERASLMDQHEGLTYERDAVRRQPFALRSSYFVNELTDDLSLAMVKRIQNRYGLEIWPWDRAGFTRST